MAQYSDGCGRYQNDYRELWAQLVPESGKATTVQGELVRVIGRLASEYYRNGNMNWSNRYDSMLSWLASTIGDERIFDTRIRRAIERDVSCIRRNAESGACPYVDGEDEYDRLTDRVVEWCLRNTDPIAVTKDNDDSF